MKGYYCMHVHVFLVNEQFTGIMQVQGCDLSAVYFLCVHLCMYIGEQSSGILVVEGMRICVCVYVCMHAHAHVCVLFA